MISPGMKREAKSGEEVDYFGDVPHCLVYQSETDGELISEQLESKDAVNLRIDELGMHPNDFAVIEGTLVKNFDSKRMVI